MDESDPDWDLIESYFTLWEMVTMVRDGHNPPSEYSLTLAEVESVGQWLEVDPRGTIALDRLFGSSRQPVSTSPPSPGNSYYDLAEFRHWVREYYSTAVYIGVQPAICDAPNCGKAAEFDGRTGALSWGRGAWAWMCASCFDKVGLGLGLGLGQRLIHEEDRPRPPPPPLSR